MTCPACNRPVATAAQVAAVERGDEWMTDGACYAAALECDSCCDGVDVAKATARRRVVYLAHPVGASTVEGVRANLARAKRWLWALRCATDWSICAPWIPAVEAVIDSGAVEHDERARGLADDLAVVDRCDAIVMVGGRVSSGMAMERDHAAGHRLRVIDLSDEGEEPEPPAMLKMLIASAELAAELVLAGEEGK